MGFTMYSISQRNLIQDWKPHLSVLIKYDQPTYPFVRITITINLNQYFILFINYAWNWKYWIVSFNHFLKFVQFGGGYHSYSALNQIVHLFGPSRLFPLVQCLFSGIYLVYYSYIRSMSLGIWTFRRVSTKIRKCFQVIWRRVYFFSGFGFELGYLKVALCRWYDIVQLMKGGCLDLNQMA